MDEQERRGHTASHGLTYPVSLLKQLPVLSPPQPTPTTTTNASATSSNTIPIRGLTSSQFSSLHLRHVLAHPPDNVLFPFLHGLEGDNEAQNMFFACNSPGVGVSAMGRVQSQTNARVPKYRGLMWVVCEEDLDGYVGVLERDDEDEEDYELEDDEDEDDDDECYSDESCDEKDFTGPIAIDEDVDAMDVDLAINRDAHIRIVQDPANEDGESENGDDKHMHPVHHRSKPIPTIQTTNLHAPSNSYSLDSSTSTSASSTFSASSSPMTASTSTCASTGSSLFPISSIPAPCTTTDSSKALVQPQSAPLSKPNTSNNTDPKIKAKPPLLTSTFRPKDLLRQADDGEWEFVAPKVPDGISLRNFGIQVPIYATISDIVVYSPKGLSPASLALAEKFRGAVERKRRERMLRLGLLPPRHPRSVDIEGSEQCENGSDEDELVRYNVFVMTADAEEMQREMPHLMMRVCGEGVGGGLEFARTAKASVGGGGTGTGMWLGKPGGTTNGTGAHTDGTDGHLNGEVPGGTEPLVVIDETMEGIEEVLAAGEDADPSNLQEAGLKPNTVDFAQREKEEMRDLTKASEIITVSPPSHKLPAEMSTTSIHWDPALGQVFLGNSSDVPLAPDMPGHFQHQHPLPPPPHPSSPPPPSSSPSPPSSVSSSSEGEPDTDPFNFAPTNDPANGYGYDICVECHDLAPFPSAAHLRAAEEHLGMLDLLWEQRCAKTRGGNGKQAEEEGAECGEGANKEGGRKELPPRPPPNANAVIHLPFPSSPPSSTLTMSSLLPVVRFFERWLQPPAPPAAPPTPSNSTSNTGSSNASGSGGARRWSSVSSLMPNFPTFPSHAPSPAITSSSFPSSSTFRSRSLTSPPPSTPQAQTPPSRTRPLKILIYSSDGYTESSVPALCLLMAVRGLSLPEAYLELQVVKRRSFFVYQSDLGVLRRVEGRLTEERERERARAGSSVNGVKRSSAEMGKLGSWSGFAVQSSNGGGREMIGPNRNPYTTTNRPSPPSHNAHSTTGGRPAAKSVSFAQAPAMKMPSPLPAAPTPTQPMIVPSQNHLVKGRPRANTSPWLPSLFGDHQSWFNDPRFDGSFPSRVLPFLYLGNLNHASNAYMLHALGITHVVSVGECALVPPPHLNGHSSAYSAASCHRPNLGPYFVPGKGPGSQGSLWMEEREGRIKVLDIKGVCDDGIDTLEPQLEPICEWIDKARAEGGQVLVHCRVGVSRSATVTIAYVMKHLGLPLVDAYLIVRSRRLSVLIQPNMRLLYNLCGWEIKLARERAGEDERRMRNELARTLSWPYLAKEVHALNEKYLH